ncbi:DNA topoisomerase I, mitochondrial-like, partial [Limulus polyphemus]|uniref:DNA topoisomerase I n=1 Tax=Limulus polyphemus TaxID=6850 RepID=A0ABM1BX24_LIMPO
MKKPVTNGLQNDVSSHESHKTKSKISSSSKSSKTKDHISQKIGSSSKHHNHKSHASHSSNSKEDFSKDKSVKSSNTSKQKENSQEKLTVHKTNDGSLKLKDSGSKNDFSLKHRNSIKKDFKSKDSLKTDGSIRKEDVKLKEDKDNMKPRKEEDKVKEYKSKELSEMLKHTSLAEKLKTESNKIRNKENSEKEKIGIKENYEKNKLKKRSDQEKKDLLKEAEKRRIGSDKKEELKIKVVHNERKEYSSHSVKEEIPLKIKIKREPEGSLNDDNIPLVARTNVPEKAKEVRLKRERDELDDDELLATRTIKNKKVKVGNTEEKPKIKAGKTDKVQKEAENKKRKAENGEALLSKKVRKEDMKIKTETIEAKKKGKQKNDQEVWKWWEEEKHEGSIKWKTLQHNGPVLAPLYEPLPKSVKFYYDGTHMSLSPEAEEVAGFYAKMLEHDYTAKDVFNKNFFKDWRKVMTQEEREHITDLKKCNFKELAEYFKQKSEERKNMSKEEKAEIKKTNEEIQEKNGFCIIDGHKQKIGNFKIEPPGLFRGRGEHPKMGMLKRRVQPEDIIINIGKEGIVPKPPEGHKWKEVRHDNTVTWLACWVENILGASKYIMLNPSSKLKGEKDWQKYETARKLYKHVDRIRNEYREDWKSKEMRVRQRAVALYFIDKLALRAGNEKEEGESADTVGCCSLRVEHITLYDEKDGKDYVVEFDFLGKDSIRYFNSVPVEKRVYKNLKIFMENKQPGDDLFDRLNTAILNKYLNELMEGLTAKVFRTFNASRTLQEQLSLLME